MAAQAAFADAHVRQRPIVRVFGVFGHDGARQLGQIASGGDLAGIRQTVSVDEIGARHAKALGGGIHFLDKRGLVARDSFCQHHRYVVGRFDDHSLQRRIDGDLRTDIQANFARWLQCRDQRAIDFICQLQLALLQGLKGDVSRHDLGERSRMPLVVRVLGVENFAV